LPTPPNVPNFPRGTFQYGFICGKSLQSILILRLNTGGTRRNELVKACDEIIYIHAMHQCPVFERIEFDSKTATTTHLKIIEKFYSLWARADYLFNGGLFCD